MTNERLRIGDADREAAAHDLGEHFAAGRITADEHGERLERIWAARTAAELAPAFADLPRLRPEPATRGGRGGRRPSHDETGWARDGADRVRDAFTPMPLLFKVLLLIVGIALVFSHLPLVLIGLAVWFLVVRRFVGPRRCGPRW